MILLIGALFVFGFTLIVVSLFAEIDNTMERREARKRNQARPMRSLYVSPSGRTVSPWVERYAANKAYADTHNGFGRVADKDMTEV